MLKRMQQNSTLALKERGHLFLHEIHFRGWDSLRSTGLAIIIQMISISKLQSLEYSIFKCLEYR